MDGHSVFVVANVVNITQIYPDIRFNRLLKSRNVTSCAPQAHEASFEESNGAPYYCIVNWTE